MLQNTFKFAAILTALILATSSTQAAPSETQVFKIDTAHSGIIFKIRHFVAKTPGKFTKFSGEIHYNEHDLSQCKAVAEIDVSSIDTANKKRDKHLNNDDYFDSDKFPAITFESTQWKRTGENTFEVTGDLTMLDVTKPVTLKVDLLGIAEGQGHYAGILMSGWSAETTIDRRDWGIVSGAPAVGNEVAIEIEIEGHKKM